MDVFAIRDEEYGQFRLDFQEVEASEGEALSLVDKLKALHGAINQKALEREAYLVESGVKVFPVKYINDRVSVEADYGAPSLGLEFYASLFDGKRSYRYEPTEEVEGVIKTHTDQARRIAKTLKGQGYKIFNGETETTYPSQIHFANGGVTRAFSDTIGLIVKRFEDTSPIRKKYAVAQSGAILVPVPTYGLFLYRLQEILDGKDITIVPVRRHDNGSVDQQSLKMQIAECQLEKRRLLGYYDCNPQNPTGHIRGRKETEEVAKILLDASNRQISEDSEFMNRAVIAAAGDPDPEIGRHLIYSTEEPYGSIVVVDDMAYEGLELIDGKKPYSFGQVSKMMAQRTIVLKGISKIGMPGMRIGMAVGHHSVIGPMADEQLTTEFTANSLGVDILAARYGEKHQRDRFKNHQKKLRRRHSARAAYMHAFFRGINKVDNLSDRDKKTLVQKYADYAGIEHKIAKTRLNAGLPNFHLPDGPDCGFFQRINCEALKGRSIAIKTDTNSWPFYTTIETSGMVHAVFKAFNINSVSAAGQGMPVGSLMTRVTLSINEPDLFRFYDKMREMHDYFWGDKPEVQLDLFRQKAVTAPAPHAP